MYRRLYNMWGLTTQSVVQSFHKIESFDFATADLSGGAIIEDEMEFVSLEIKNMLPQWVQNAMDRIEYEIITPDSTGTFSPTFAALAPVVGWDYNYNKCTGYSNQDVLYNSRLCNPIKCLTPECVESTLTQLTIIDNSDGTYTVVDWTGGDIVISYDIDTDLVVYNSLLPILRAGVCCNLGNKIFTTQDPTQVTAITSHYCENYQKWMGLIEKGWIPPEFKKIKLLFKPVKGIYFLNTRRIN
jgi:hypothetical protein